MFEVVALKDMDILSMELDIFADTSKNNLAVEIFTFPGPFDSVVGVPAAWSLVADTQLVPAPTDRRAMIVPVSEFTPVTLQAYEKHSFYVTLTGPYLDHSVNALDKTGEMFIENDDIQLFVGEGTHEYKFPEQMDTVLDPQFAGVVHYQLKDDGCTGPTEKVTTTIEYTYMTDLTSDLLYECMQEALVDYHSYAFPTSDDVSVPSLIQPKSVVYTGDCPLEWKDCPSVYYTLEVQIAHTTVTFTDGDIAFEFFKPELLSLVDEEITKRRGRSIYLGHTSTLASFSIGLLGVAPFSVPSEADYFQFVTKTFLEDTIPINEALVWGLSVEDNPDEQRMRRAQAEKTTIRGVVRGAIPVGANLSSFRFALEAAFRNNQVLYRSMILETGKLRPGHSSWMSFVGFQDAIADFETLPLPQTIPSRKISKNVVGAIFGSIAAVAFVIALVLLYRYQRIKARNYRELQEYRAAKRTERRAKRAASTKLQDDPETRGGTGLGAQIACGSAYMSCQLSTTDATPAPSEESSGTMGKCSHPSPESKPRSTPLARHLDAGRTEAATRSGSSGYSIGSYSAARERTSLGQGETQRRPTELRTTRTRSVPSQLASPQEVALKKSQPVPKQHSLRNRDASFRDETRAGESTVKRPDLPLLRDPPSKPPTTPRALTNEHYKSDQLSGVEVTVSNTIPSASAVSQEPATRALLDHASSFTTPGKPSAATMQRTGSLQQIPTKEFLPFSPSPEDRAFSRTRSHSPGLGTLPASLPKRAARP